jgi:hypothetical protein
MGDTMTVIELPRAFAPTNVDGALMSWWDSDAECTVAIARPSDDDLWQRYLAGAERSYRSHGIGAALDVDAIRRSRDTTLFWTMLDATGTVVGGIRAIGPLTSPDETHAVTEWAGQPSHPTVRKMIADRLPFGVVEMKSAWVTADPDRSRSMPRHWPAQAVTCSPCSAFSSAWPPARITFWRAGGRREAWWLRSPLRRIPMTDTAPR